MNPETAADALEDKGKKGENLKKPIKHINIHKMDDGSYTVKAETGEYGPGQNSYESAHKSPHDAMRMVRDHMTSPHLPKLGSGERFAKLKDELASKPGIRNPAALAASIGRKKFGAKKFDALSQK